MSNPHAINTKPYKEDEEDFSSADVEHQEPKEESNLELAVHPNPGKTLPTRWIICTPFLVLGFAMCFIELGGDRKINQTLAIAIWMGAFWLTEAIPLVVTAFIPLFAFPMFGIVKSKVITATYTGDTIFLFISGIMLALTLERWNLHSRFSLKVLSWCGAKPVFLLFGMMFSTFVLSMFVSNTATAIMMVPNAIAVCSSLDHSSEQAKASNPENSRRFGIAVMLGIAYAANVGGLSSIIGTPPNLVFQAQLGKLFPDAPEVSFADWLGFGLPFGLVCFFVTWAYLCVMYLRGVSYPPELSKNLFIDQYKALGPWCFEDITVALSFVGVAFLWVFRKDINLSSFKIQGWSNVFPEAGYISDATIGMLMVFLMFITPARRSKLPLKEQQEEEPEKEEYTHLLTWKTAKKLPLDIIFLFGGGFALAKGFVESGLSKYIGEKLGDSSLSTFGTAFLLVFVIIWLTELTSNTATSNIMIPIAASIAVGAKVSPYTMMIPTALACSCAFCLPIATPPNMVVFASGRLPLIEMNKTGVVLNLFCTFLIIGAAFTIVPAILGVSPDEFPAWAANSTVAS